MVGLPALQGGSFWVALAKVKFSGPESFSSFGTWTRFGQSGETYGLEL